MEQMGGAHPHSLQGMDGRERRLESECKQAEVLATNSRACLWAGGWGGRGEGVGGWVGGEEGYRFKRVSKSLGRPVSPPPFA